MRAYLIVAFPISILQEMTIPYLSTNPSTNFLQPPFTQRIVKRKVRAVPAFFVHGLFKNSFSSILNL